MNFDNPVVKAIAAFSIWILIFFPFPLIARRIAWQDAFNGIES